MGSLAKGTTGPTALISRNPLRWLRARLCSSHLYGLPLLARRPFFLEKSLLASSPVRHTSSTHLISILHLPLCPASRTTAFDRSGTSYLGFTIPQPTGWRPNFVRSHLQSRSVALLALLDIPTHSHIIQATNPGRPPECDQRQSRLSRDYPSKPQRNGPLLRMTGAGLIVSGRTKIQIRSHPPHPPCRTLYVTTATAAAASRARKVTTLFRGFLLCSTFLSAVLQHITAWVTITSLTLSRGVRPGFQFACDSRKLATVLTGCSRRISFIELRSILHTRKAYSCPEPLPLSLTRLLATPSFTIHKSLALLPLRLLHSPDTFSFAITSVTPPRALYSRGLFSCPLALHSVTCFSVFCIHPEAIQRNYTVIPVDVT